MSSSPQTRIILKPMGFLIFAIVPTLAIIIGFIVQNSKKSNTTGINKIGIIKNESITNAPIAPVRLDARSPVLNASFEEREGEQKPAQWEVALAGNNATQVSYTEASNGTHSGGYHLTHYGGDAYDVRTTQLLTGLKNGKYTLRAWAKKRDGKNESYLIAKDFAPNTPKKVTFIPASLKEYVQVEVRDIEVQNGQCVIGVFSKAEGGAWTYVDDVELLPQ